MDFAITALPRSGTAWASVWLMDGDALCIHEPFAHHTPEQLVAYAPGRRWGVACTALWRAPKFLASLKCPYVILDRNIEEVRRSVQELGLPPLSEELIAKFDLLPGPRFDHTDLFDLDGALEIWSILRPDRLMDVARWRLLCEMKIQVDFYKWNPDPALMRDMLVRLTRGM